MKERWQEDIKVSWWPKYIAIYAADLEPYENQKLRHSATACQKAGEPNFTSPLCFLFKKTC